MLSKRMQFSSKLFSKISIYNLAFGWSLFLTAGVWIGGLSAGSVFSSLSFSLASDKSYLFTVLFRLIVFVSSLIFIQTELRWGILLLAAIRSFCYGFLIGNTYVCFGNAGWLVCFLNYFSNSICVFIELLLWSFLINANGRTALKLVVASFVLELVVFWVDYLFILPFTSVLL